ncbi:MAG: branched-chain amino acid ABC transporter permease [Rhodospirillaceae bacterium]|jgi:branched-chain amino acid transport system permease protein|nr:branched-chain amino acid ABC transporter permease [Rhodospirillaceae bacterium]MBT5359487.1 branched-chain amino acid ABC transporter permease [Rhodospirillaceae bacterium]MBT5768320.1 branched-chain amino acid ABC transporter permease [Rhodospirillaceae bacterium]MBT6309649.1 branched-chain amino acid ABC transporter permease [Rhodospirillaceae bacterium]
MDYVLLIEQFLNGFQLGIILFLMAAGLTLVFGIMDLVNLAHGSMFMIGAFVGGTIAAVTGSFVIGVVLMIPAMLLIGMAVEMTTLRTLYPRDHLDHVLATFGLILFFNAATRLIWGPEGLVVPLPDFLEGSVALGIGITYPVYRIMIIVVGLLVALGLYVLVAKTRIGMLIRAGASNRTMAGALGVNIPMLFSVVFGIGAVLAGLAGLIITPITAAQIGMGEDVLILAFVVIVIGGIGSIRGAFIASIVTGVIDTMGRSFLDVFLLLFLPENAAESAGPALSSMMIYILMAAILFFRPQGLFPPKGAQ